MAHQTIKKSGINGINGALLLVTLCLALIVLMLWPNGAQAAGTPVYGLYNYDGTTEKLYECDENGVKTTPEAEIADKKTVTNLFVENGVTAIPNSAFEYCRALESVKLPEGLMTLGESVFAYCRALTSVELPTTLTSIGRGAFVGSGLTSVKLPEGLTTLGDYVFNSCRALTSVELPTTLTSISNNVFDSCSALTSVKLPEGITTLGNLMFARCSALKSVELPKSLTSIGSGAFAYSGLTSVKLPEGLMTLEVGMFDSCSALTSVELPKSLTSIGDRAFINCSSLARITLSSAEPPTLGGNAFNGLPSPRYMELVGDAATSGKYGDLWEGFTKTKLLSIEGLTATDRAYDTTTKVVLTGGSLKGIEASDNVTATMPTEGTMDNATAGENKPVSITLPALEGTDSIKYSLLTAPDIKVNIAKINQAALSIKNSENTTYTPEAIELQAEGGSGNGAITWTKEDKTGASTLEGNKLTVTKCGTIKVTATKAGDDNYNEIAVEKDIEINKANQAVLNITSGDTTYAPEAIELQAEGGSGNGAITWTKEDKTGVSILEGNKLTVTKCGTIKVTATKAGDDNYNEGTLAEKEITITKANQAAFSIKDLESTTYRPDGFTLESDGGSGTGAVTFGITDAGTTGAKLVGSKLTVDKCGTLKLRATKAGDDNYNAATSAEKEITINKADQAALSIKDLANPTYRPDGFTLESDGGSGTGAVTFGITDAGTTGAKLVGSKLTVDKCGTIKVTATKAGDDNYNEITVEKDIEITKATGNGTVTLENWVYGQTPKTPVAESATNGNTNVTYAYKAQGAEDSTYTPDQPKDVGSYTVRATFAENDNYTQVLATADFEITKANQAAFSIKDLESTTYRPVGFTLESDGGSGTGAVTFAITDAGTTGAKLVGSKITVDKCGTLKLTATKAGDDNYNAATSAEKEITITKATGNGTVTLENWVYGQTPKTPVAESATNGNTNVTYAYKAQGAEDSTYTPDQPKDVGSYTVRATFAENDNYTQVLATADFEITKANQAAFSIKDLESTTYRPDGFTLESDGGSGTGAVTFAITDAGTTGAKLVGSKLTVDKCGTIKVTATKAADDNYNEITVEKDIEITKATGNGTVTLENWVYGQTPKTPVAESATNGNTNVTYAYKAQGAEDSTYTPDQPKDVGSYTVRATFAETNNYTQVLATADFEITKANQAAFSIKDLESTTYRPDGFTLESDGGSGTGAVTFTITDAGTTGAKLVGSKITVDKCGTLKLTATKAGDDNYNAATSAEKEITINKADQAALSIKDLANPTYRPDGFTLESDGGSGSGAVTFAITDAGTTGAKLVGSKLTVDKCGTLKVTATKAGDDNYNEITVEKDIEITKATGNGTVTLENWVYGQTPKTPVAESATNGNTNVTYAYKAQGAEDSTYTPDQPKDVGSYTVRATFAENDNYTQAIATADFEITKAGKIDQEKLSIKDLENTTYTPAGFTLETEGGSGTGAIAFEVIEDKGNINAKIVGNKLTVDKEGTIKIKATKAGDATYNPATAEKEITITKAGDLKFESKTVEYDTKEHSLKVEGTIPEGCSVTYEPESVKDAGVHTMKATISGQGYEPKTLTATLTIKAASPAITLAAEADKPIVIGQPITLTAEVKGVGGEVPTGTVTVLEQKVTLKDGKAQFSYTPETNAPVEITAVFEPDGENYTKADTKIKLTAGQKTREAITCDAIAATYGDTDMALNPKGGSLQDSESYGYEVVTGKDIIETNNNGVLTILKAGAATVRVSLPETQTYTATSCDVAVTVAKADITGITYNDQSITFDEADHSLVITGNLPQGVTVAYENNTHKKPGTYSAKAMIDGGTNYNSQTLSATLTILLKPLILQEPKTPQEITQDADILQGVGNYETLSDEEKTQVKEGLALVTSGMYKMDEPLQAQILKNDIIRLSELYNKVYNVKVIINIQKQDGVKNSINPDSLEIYGAQMAAGIKDGSVTLNVTQMPAPDGFVVNLKLELTTEGKTSLTLQSPIILKIEVPQGIQSQGITVHHLNADGSLKEKLTTEAKDNTISFMTTSFSNFLFEAVSTPVPPQPVKPDNGITGDTTKTTKTIINPITGQPMAPQAAALQGGALLVIIGLATLAGWQCIKKRK